MKLLLNHRSIITTILLVVSFQASAFNTIKNIRYVGNEKTQDSVLNRVLSVVEGDLVDSNKLESSVQSIMDLGLFAEASYVLEENGADYDIIFRVKEKHYLLVLPRLKYRDGQLHKGIQLRLDNLFGLDHKLHFLYENKGDNNGIQEKRRRFNYSYPWFLGSSHTLDLTYIVENTTSEQLSGQIFNNDDIHLSLDSTFWLNEKQVSEGPYIGMGAAASFRNQTDINTDNLVNSVSATTVTFKVGNKYSHIHKFNRSGKSYEYSVTAAGEFTGSKTAYFKHLLFYTSYYTFKSRPGDNLNVYVGIGHSTNDILNESAFILDSRNQLRGYDRGRYKGNAMYIVNTEYLTPSGNYPNLRYVAFIDAGSTSDRATTLFEQNVKFGVGFGIRWKLPSFVNVDIRVDIGYGVDDGTVLTTFGTKNIF